MRFKKYREHVVPHKRYFISCNAYWVCWPIGNWTFRRYEKETVSCHGYRHKTKGYHPWWANLWTRCWIKKVDMGAYQENQSWKIYHYELLTPWRSWRAGWQNHDHDERLASYLRHTRVYQEVVWSWLQNSHRAKARLYLNCWISWLENLYNWSNNFECIKLRKANPRKPRLNFKEADLPSPFFGGK